MVKARRNADPSDRSALHVDIDLAEDDIHAINKEEGWLSRRCV